MKNRVNWTLLLDRYIPLQKYTVPKNEKLRYRRGLTERPQCPPGHKGQRLGDNTFTVSPVQSVRARTGGSLCCVSDCVHCCKKQQEMCVRVYWRATPQGVGYGARSKLLAG